MLSKTKISVAIVSAVALVVLLLLLPHKEEVRSESAESGHVHENEVVESGMQAELDSALVMINSGAPMEGILALRDVADKYPEEALPQFYLGMFSIQTGQLEKAIGRFERVVELEPNNTEAWKMLGQVYLELENNEKARESFERFLELPTDEEAKRQVEKVLEEI